MTLDQTLYFIAWLVIASAYCVGFHTVMVKLFIEEILSTTIEEFWNKASRPWKLIHKPLWACPACMASLYGTAIYFMQVSIEVDGLWIPFCICLCGLNFFVSQFFVE